MLRSGQPTKKATYKQFSRDRYYIKYIINFKDKLCFTAIYIYIYAHAYTYIAYSYAQPIDL